MRFGIGMNTDHTLEEVGQQFNVTRERIRQIEAKALRKLKHPSRSRKLRSFLDKHDPAGRPDHPRRGGRHLPADGPAARQAGARIAGRMKWSGWPALQRAVLPLPLQHGGAGLCLVAAPHPDRWRDRTRSWPTPRSASSVLRDGEGEPASTSSTGAPGP
jgi:hypothetical protein